MPGMWQYIMYMCLACVGTCHLVHAVMCISIQTFKVWTLCPLDSRVGRPHLVTLICKAANERLRVGGVTGPSMHSPPPMQQPYNLEERVLGVTTKPVHFNWSSPVHSPGFQVSQPPKRNLIYTLHTTTYQCELRKLEHGTSL